MILPKAIQSIERELSAVEANIRKNVRSHIPLVPEVGHYVFDSGGKRVRPSLLLLCYHLCGGRAALNGHSARPVNIAGMMELLHSATLLHDDVVDGATVRRGQKSVNAEWGNRVSILMGDYLFSRVSSTFVEDGDMAIMRIIVRTITAMVEGELIQLTAAGTLPSSEGHYLTIITKKTASLFAACCECGAVIGGGTPSRVRALREFGYSLGIAFQVIDDSLDYSNPKSFGKALGTDLKNGKLTLPLIYVLRDGTPAERRRTAAILTSMDPSGKKISDILDLIKKYRGIERSERMAHAHITRAKKLLAPFRPSPEKDALLWIADYVLSRDR